MNKYLHIFAQYTHVHGATVFVLLKCVACGTNVRVDPYFGEFALHGWAASLRTRCQPVPPKGPGRTLISTENVSIIHMYIGAKRHTHAQSSRMYNV